MKSDLMFIILDTTCYLTIFACNVVFCFKFRSFVVRAARAARERAPTRTSPTGAVTTPAAAANPAAASPAAAGKQQFADLQLKSSRISV